MRRFALLLVLCACGSSPRRDEARAPALTKPVDPSALPDTNAADASVVPTASPSPPAEPRPTQSASAPPAATSVAPEPPAPPARSAACPPKTKQWSYPEGERAFSAVQKGWSRARVLTELGGPDECQGASVTYVAGPYTGPELRVTYTFAKDRVVNVTRTVTGCRLVE